MQCLLQSQWFGESYKIMLIVISVWLTLTVIMQKLGSTSSLPIPVFTSCSLRCVPREKFRNEWNNADAYKPEEDFAPKLFLQNELNETDKSCRLLAWVNNESKYLLLPRVSFSWYRNRQKESIKIL